MSSLNSVIRFAKSTVVAAVATLGLGKSSFAQQYSDGTVYGSFVRFNETPEILFLIDEIEEGDFFELRRAMRDQPTKLLVTHSPGGSVYEALQVATVIHDNQIATYIPPDAHCSSACAFIFFGGAERFAEGELGVHQFYAGEGAGEEQVDLSTGLKAAQYTTAEIIGFLNEFGTPPFVYEKMFSTGDMYFFTAAERSALARAKIASDLDSLRKEAAGMFSRIKPNLPSIAPDDAVGTVASEAPPAPEAGEFERFFSYDLPGSDFAGNGIRGITLEACEELCHGSASCVAYSYVAESAWCWPKHSVGTLIPKAGVISGKKLTSSGLSPIEKAAIEVLIYANYLWSQPNEVALTKLPTLYSSTVEFYSNEISRTELMQEKINFATRWPVRSYEVDPSTVNLSCAGDTCYVESVVNWSAASPVRGASSSGRSTWNILLIYEGNTLKIRSEGGAVLSRN